MRGDLKVQWSGEDVTSCATTASSLITFTPRIRRKGVVKRELRALVTDADGLVATASRVVEIPISWTSRTTTSRRAAARSRGSPSSLTGSTGPGAG